MKIKQELNEYLVYYYYEDIKTNYNIYHGLFNNYLTWGIGYHYHNIEKGFWLRKNIILYDN